MAEPVATRKRISRREFLFVTLFPSILYLRYIAHVGAGWGMWIAGAGRR